MITEEALRAKNLANKISPRNGQVVKQKAPLIINSSKPKGAILISQMISKHTSTSKRQYISKSPISIGDHTDGYKNNRLLSFSDDPERSPSSNPPNLPSNLAQMNHFKQRPQHMLTSRSIIERVNQNKFSK